MWIDDDLYRLAVELGDAALARGLRITAAESCTGGLIAGAITSVAGSSDWFDCGFVTYSNEAKIRQLAVSPATLETFGAVSEQTALAMARGALGASRAQWALAVTGIAGPAGGKPDKPVGTVCFAWAGPEAGETLRTVLPGTRADIRLESVRIALQGLLDRMA
jgi:nicotinamide-nucleotide amidase